jgi:hypothetical protein
MEKTLIKLVNNKVTDNFINVSSDGTSFCYMERKKFRSVEDIKKDVKRIRKDLKDKGIKLGKTDTLSILNDKDYKLLYEKSIEKYNKLFDELITLWEQKLEEGIYYGCSDDEFLNSKILPLQNEINSMFNRNKVFYKYLNIENKIVDLKYTNKDYLLKFYI